MNTFIDIKRLTKEERKGLRIIAFEKYKAGQNASQAAKDLGVRPQSVGRWFRAFKRVGGVSEEQKRGPAEGRTSKLSLRQQADLAKAITDKTQEQLKFDFALWSAKAVRELVRWKYGVELSLRTVHRLLKKLGFTSQRPNRYAREQNSVAVKEWMATKYPAIRRKAVEENGTIYWADEAAVYVSAFQPRGYAPIGKTPAVREPANRGMRVNMISAVTNKGDLRFMAFDGAMNVSLFKQFMTRLCKDSMGKVFLIVDHLKVHHANCLQEWLEARKDKIEVFCLPSYSPELNPDEYLNRDVKANVGQRKTATSIQELHSQTRSHLKTRQRNKSSVAKLFHHPKVRYAM